jgi:His/Glu/Gln/Arg/opine family amino acid ABC transporter permease subunit
MSFDFGAVWENRYLFAEGFQVTVLVSVLAIPISVILGTIVALMRISDKIALKWVSIGYIEIIRNVPFLVLIFMVFYALPFLGIRFSGLATGIVCMSIYGAAYIAEIVRGGIQSVPSGQFDAGRALGLSYYALMRKVIFPQILEYVFPPGVNIFLTMIKESSLLSMITVTELTYMAHDINGRTFSPVETFTVIAILYWIISNVTLCIAHWIHRKSTRLENLELELGRG